MTIRSVNVAGSGKWLTALLQQKVFKHYAAHNAELRRLAKRVSTWLADAQFCVAVTEVEGNAQVPLSTQYDIKSFLKFSDIMAYRTLPQGSTIAQVVRLGGADATFTMPCFLLPHHEHILPSKPSATDEAKQAHEVEQADGLPRTVQEEHKLEEVQKDETHLRISVHASLPACFDQSLLGFIAALVKATKMIELEKEASDESEPPAVNNHTNNNNNNDEPISPASSTFSLPRADTDTDADSLNGGPPARTDSGFKAFTKNFRQGMRDGTTRDVIKDLARDMHKSTTDGMKKAAVGSFLNDKWIAKMVGKIAARLERAQGDVGYSGTIPIALGVYREKADGVRKLLP